MCDEMMSEEEWEAIQQDAILKECVADPAVAKMMSEQIIRETAIMLALQDPNVQLVNSSPMRTIWSIK